MSTESEDEHREAMKALQKSQRDARKTKTEQRGVVLVHTGEGKGKSSSAFGVAIRAAGHGQRVAIVQFIKGTWKTGEQEAFKRFPEITHVVAGNGFTWNTQDQAGDREAAQAGWAQAAKLIANEDIDVVILDELNVALHYKQLDLPPILKAIRDRPQETSVIITGRDAAPELIALADTVTEMKSVKHAYEAGILARRGIEF
ncbi:MAG: cob(I)yrinic acid a,c-diamide adenosyltransferase [Myxococcota bacterium]